MGFVKRKSRSALQDQFLLVLKKSGGEPNVYIYYSLLVAFPTSEHTGTCGILDVTSAVSGWGALTGARAASGSLLG